MCMSIDLRRLLMKLILLLLYLSICTTKAFTMLSTQPQTTKTKTQQPSLSISTATSTSTTQSEQQVLMLVHAAAGVVTSSTSTTTTSTTIRYKNNEYDDDYYPIPIGTTFVPGLESLQQQQQQEQQTPIFSSLSTPVMSRSYSTDSTTEPYYDSDNCYYPIPIFGGSSSSSSSSITTSSSISLPEVVKVLPKPSITIDPTTRIRQSTTNKKPVLTTITKFREFVNYLEDDNRLTIVQFVAPWCKTCQKLKMNMKQIMLLYGDTIVDRKKVIGTIRFAQIEYIPKTENLITDILQIQGVPTIQMYYNTNKVWCNTGFIQSKDIIYEINNWNTKLATETLSNNKSIQEYATSLDDGILASAIETNFYDDYLDFLEEEW